MINGKNKGVINGKERKNKGIMNGKKGKEVITECRAEGRN